MPNVLAESGPLPVAAAKQTPVQKKSADDKGTDSLTTLRSQQETRQQFAITLHAKLESATTSEQKQAAVDEYQVAMESQLLQVVTLSELEVAPELLVARMKASAGNDTRQLAQVSRLERTFEDLAELQARLVAINEAQGARKQALVDEFRAFQELKVKEREAELTQSEIGIADTDDEQTSPSLPEVEARLAKVKKQQESYEKTMAAVEATSSPEEKARLIDAWHAQVEAEIAARTAEVQHLEIP